MVQLEIDGKQISVENGTSVLEAANQTGTFIPHFCYHKKLSIAANCRMCLIDVEKMPKPMPACATTASEGMKVFTHSEKAEKAQKGVMEFLLLNHPLDCPVCDQGGECQLQDLAVGYGQSHSRFIERKNVVKPKDMGPLVAAIEMSRCIHCTRCIRFTQEIAGYQEIGMINRGEHSEIISFVDKVLTTELSGNVIDLCPVGALTSKPFRYNSRTWELSRRKSISAHDSLGSNLEVQVKDKTVRRVLPRENEDINECWLSDKDRFAYEGLNHAERVHQPLIKQDNRWHKVDWQTALEYVAKGLSGVANDHGKDSIGIWANNNNTLEELYLLRKIAKEFGITGFDSALRLRDKRLQTKNSGALWLGQTIPEFLSSDVIVVIGAYLRQDQPLLTARIRQAVAKGAKLIVVQSQKEDLHIPGVVQKVVSPQQWIALIEKILAHKDPEIKKLLAAKDDAKISIVLGEEAQMSAEFTELYSATQNLAEKLSATLGILPNSANAVGAEIINSVIKLDNVADIVEMLATPRKAVILANVEPDIDVYHGSQAKQVLTEAETVISLSPYTSESLLELTDVILPIATFTETPGSFINMDGTLQSFYSTSPTIEETKPLWKVLRVLGTILGLEGFEYETVQEVLKDALLEDSLSHLLNNHIKQSEELIKEPTNGSTDWLRVGGVSIYSTDAIVRRAEALQKTPQAAIPALKINSKMLEELGASNNETLLVSQEGGEPLSLDIIIDDSLPDYVAYLPLHPSNANLGALMTHIDLKRG